MAAEGRLQNRQALVAAKAAHALLGLDHGADRPALDHASVAPAADVLAELAHPADQVLDLIGNRYETFGANVRPRSAGRGVWCDHPG